VLALLALLASISRGAPHVAHAAHAGDGAGFAAPGKQAVQQPPPQQQQQPPQQQPQQQARALAADAPLPGVPPRNGPPMTPSDRALWDHYPDTYPWWPEFAHLVWTSPLFDKVGAAGGGGGCVATAGWN
jgi:hypothetical protein